MRWVTNVAMVIVVLAGGVPTCRWQRNGSKGVHFHGQSVGTLFFNTKYVCRKLNKCALAHTDQEVARFVMLPCEQRPKAEVNVANETHCAAL